MAPSRIFQILLRIAIQNQIGIAQWIIVDEVVQFSLLCHGNVQRILDPSAINGDHSPIPEQQLHTAVWNEPELVGVRPLHLACARPLCRLKAPLGLSLLRNRGILISEENKKSEPFSYREKVRIFIVWCDGRDSNPRPTDS